MDINGLIEKELNKTSRINTFVKGMNSDQAYDQLSEDQYTFAKNIRITKNKLVNSDDIEIDQSVHEGVVSPIPFGKDADSLERLDDFCGEILATDSIGDIFVIITEQKIQDLQEQEASDSYWLIVYKGIVDNDKDTVKSFKEWWKFKLQDELQSVSTVIYRELNNVIKLYIATGKHPVIQMRIDSQDSPYINNGVYEDSKYLMDNIILPINQVKINGIVEGTLKTSQVQYTYRYYNKYGNTTKLAPLTNKIQVINSNRSKETGNAEDTETSVGFSLSIQDPSAKHFERIQIYRVQYIKYNQNAEINMIFDGDLPQRKESEFIFNDVGGDSIQNLSIEEFTAMQGIKIIPKIISQNQQYMFASNVFDDTIILGVDKTEQNDLIDVVHTQVNLHEFEDFVNYKKTSSDAQKPVFGSNVISQAYPYSQSSDSTKIDIDVYTPTEPKTINSRDFDIEKGVYGNQDYKKWSKQNYLADRNINVDSVKCNYDDMFTSSLLRSLRQGEEYKYGIVYYDSFGRRSDVIPVGEVTVDLGPTTTKETDQQSGDVSVVTANVYGVCIKLPQPKYKVSRKLVENIVGCQIVRRSSKSMYQKTLLQVALSRPACQPKSSGVSVETPYYPTGFMWTGHSLMWPGMNNALNPCYYLGNISSASSRTYHAENIEKAQASPCTGSSLNTFKNNKLFQIFSSEIDVRRNDVLNSLTQSDISLHPLFVNGCTNKKTNISDSLDVSPVEDLFCQNQYITEQLNVGINYGGRAFLLSSVTDSNVFIPNTDNPNGYDVYASNIISPTPGYIFNNNSNQINSSASDYMFVNKLLLCRFSGQKQDSSLVFNYYQQQIDLLKFDRDSIYEISNVKDVKIPKWHEAFDNYMFDGAAVTGATSQYKEFQTSIDNYTYNNWVSSGLYNLSVGPEAYGSGNYITQNNDENKSWVLMFMPVSYTMAGQILSWFSDGTQQMLSQQAAHCSSGQIKCHAGLLGTGSSCFVLTLKDEDKNAPINRLNTPSVCICNIEHNPVLNDTESEEFEQYFGFGNFFKLERVGNQYKVVHNYTDDNNKPVKDDYMVVFDGDVYVTPHELVTMYKTYDFNSLDSLQSTQVVNYVPLESKINTYFDYGMNYRNSKSANLLYDAGSIDGVTSQDRPAHQYNMIYSDNDSSNDVFTLITTDESETNNFKQRTYYSEPKTNGDFVDSFGIFKAASFIDVDSRYGEITDLLTDKNTLYFWQNTAFGKFSVNERSLINDTNGNTIMLGQAGVLQRSDYLSTKYGMRPDDFSAINSEGGIFWLDINNRAVVMNNQNSVVNYGERMNVQNIINKYIDIDSKPYIDYDVQNDELICKFLNNEEQLIFNLKYGFASSIYTRDYLDLIYINNHMYGINKKGDDILVTKYNYLGSFNVDSSENLMYLSPLYIQFVVNPAVYSTKTFDNQILVSLKRKDGLLDGDFLNNITYSFETDIINKFEKSPIMNTDREGNISYVIPRYSGDWGNRVRGKWMRESITNTNPDKYFSISHIITKYRNSYS